MEASEESFVQKYDLWGCIQCGKCTGGCPVSLKSPLNMRRLVRDVTLMEEEGSIDATGMMEYIWDCTACNTCTLRCPKEVKPSEAIFGMRGTLIETGQVPTTIRDALESTFKNGNPWDRARAKRSEWAEELNLKNMSEGADVMLYVGCTPAYDPRIQEVAKSLVAVLQSAGIDFATLGNDETCCGNEVRRMGEEGLFEILVEDNTELFGNYDIKKMVTISPHCYNTFVNEYNLSFEVQHYSQFLADLIDEGKLTFSKEIDKTVTYHDPCFLGKQNKVFDEPRKLIEAIPGVKLVDMDRSRERSLCCEGGGGRMWVDVEGERNGEIRINDAMELDAEIMLTSCPFCIINLEDAAKTTGNEENIKVMDVLELMAEAL